MYKSNPDVLKLVVDFLNDQYPFDSSFSIDVITLKSSLSEQSIKIIITAFLAVKHNPKITEEQFKQDTKLSVNKIDNELLGFHFFKSLVLGDDIYFDVMVETNLLPGYHNVYLLDVNR
ncbi:hypothetical protein AB6D24_05645 [Vibrio splendidus]